MIYKALIFDMDGTIIETEQAWAQATRKLIEQKTGSCPISLYDSIREKIQGLDITNSCKVIKEMACITDDLKTLCAEKEELAHAFYKKGIVFIEGFEEFHEKLLTRGIKTAIATNARSSTIQHTQDALNIKRFFGKHIYGLDLVEKGKPHPDIYLFASDKIGVDPRLCVSLEDSAHGIKAAKQAGMFSIGINTTKIYAQVAGADYIVDAYKDIDIDMLFEAVK